MPDEATPTAAPNAGLDDLERRLASFENATRRLGRTVSDIADPVTTGHSSPPRPATRRLSESGAPRGEEISGLRPAVASQGPQTGALTARSRASAGPAPAFTSAFGRPTIPSTVRESRDPAAMATSRRHVRPLPWWRQARYAMPLGLLAGVILLTMATRPFRELTSAEVLAETVRCETPIAGVVAAVDVHVGEAVTAGRPLVRVADTQVVAAQDGIVVRLLATPGARLAAGEPVAELALPTTLRVVLPLPSMTAANVGDRVSVRLLGEDRTIGGMIERVQAAGESGAWNRVNVPVPRAVIILDPAPVPARLGQGACVTLLGRDPGPLTQALHALRRMMPW
jgi:biotin carboxyl carrier protein